jgi:hypothetical protein
MLTVRIQGFTYLMHLRIRKVFAWLAIRRYLPASACAAPVAISANALSAARL